MARVFRVVRAAVHQIAAATAAADAAAAGEVPLADENNLVKVLQGKKPVPVVKAEPTQLETVTESLRTMTRGASAGTVNTVPPPPDMAAAIKALRRK